MITPFGPSVLAPYAAQETRLFIPGEHIEEGLPYVEVAPLGLPSQIDQSKRSLAINVGALASFFADDHFPTIEVIYVRPNPDEPPLKHTLAFVDGRPVSRASRNNLSVTSVLDRKNGSLGIYINRENLNKLALDQFSAPYFISEWLMKLDHDMHGEARRHVNPVKPSALRVFRKLGRTQFFTSMFNISDEELEIRLKEMLQGPEND